MTNRQQNKVVKVDFPWLINALHKFLDTRSEDVVHVLNECLRLFRSNELMFLTFAVL